jgi:FMN-dependent NADH-azoreductase
MAKVLYIKANAKLAEESRTFKLSDSFIEAYRRNHPEDEVLTLDLYDEGIGFLPRGGLGELRGQGVGDTKSHPIMKYAHQFAEADKYVIAAPFWNLSFPAILKAYIDYIMIAGITFKYTATGVVGLCKGDKAVHFVTRGGDYGKPPFSDFEMGDRYLRVILTFMGIKDLTTISANGLDIIGNDPVALVEEAIQKAQELAKSF